MRQGQVGQMPTLLLIAFFYVLALMSTLAASHGMMCTPRQRAAYHSTYCGSNLPSPPTPPLSELLTDYCSHCLNGGNKATVNAHLPSTGWKVYDPIGDFSGSAAGAGLCGDPKGADDHMIGGDWMPYQTVPIVSNWKTGGVVDFTAEIDTNHNGYFEFFLCNLDKCGTADIDAKCFTGGHCYKLERVSHPDCQSKDVNTNFECGPVDPAYLGRWYLPCRKGGHVSKHIVGGSSGTMRYRLPPGVTCKHCVVQWYWATANSCAPRGFLAYFENLGNPFGTTCEGDGGARGAHVKGMAECGGQNNPEEFWSCADVQITADGKSAGPVRAVGIPPPDGDSDEPSAEEEVKNDPDGFREEAEEELEKSINETASGDNGSGGEGNCLSEGVPCTAETKCCGTDLVCVRGFPEAAFTCRYWWSLWKDAEDRGKAQPSM